MHAGTRAVGAEVPSDFFHQGTVGPLMPDFLYFLKKLIYFSLKKKKKTEKKNKLKKK